MVYIVYFYCRWQYLCVILFKCFFKIHNIFLNENILQRIERMSYSSHHLFFGHNLLVDYLLPLPGDPLLEPCVQHHVHHAAQRLLGLVLQQLLLTSNTNIFPQYLCQIKCDAAHPGDDPDGGPDLGVPGKVVLVLLPLLHLGLLQAGLPLPGQAHPLHAQYVIR